jgi:ribosomal subunit interface protein
MKIDYTGQPRNFTAAQQKKLSASFAKLAKLVDRREEKLFHVVFSQQRHLTRAEVAMHCGGRDSVAIANGTDSFAALMEAAEKLEQQILKARARRRDTARTPASKRRAAAVPAPPLSPEKEAPPKPARLKRVQVSSRRKPMTPDEAMLALGPEQHYLPFRDTDTGAVSILIRRPDGHFDLMET